MPQIDTHGRSTTYLLLARALGGLAILAAEIVWTQTTVVVHNFRAVAGVVGTISPLIMQVGWLIFPVLMFPFALLTLGSQLRVAGIESPALDPFRWTPLAWHALFFSAFAAASLMLRSATLANRFGLTAGMALWLALGAGSSLFLVTAFLPRRLLALKASREWLAGLSVAGASVLLGIWAQGGWQSSSVVTIACVKWVLAHLGYQLGTKLASVVGTNLFSVAIAPSCSGYEGMGLFFVFSAGWLWWFRKEFRFPAALALIPLGVALSWSLNIVRLVLLILIGHYGHGDIALSGFHSRAGWIAFSVLAIGFCAVANRIPGVTARGPVERSVRASFNPAGPYLAPFVAVQAAAMIAAAASQQFEWLYPLRIAAALAALAVYRKEYSRLCLTDLRLAAWIGICGFAVWIVFSLHLPRDAGPLAALRQASFLWRSTWVACRIAGLVLIAPLVEELAFRGFLMRRIEGAGFVTLDPRRVGPIGVGVSSLCFGLLHGVRWMEGAVAGLLFAFAYKRRGQLSTAILAHAVTNLLLFLLIAVTGDWKYL